VAARATDATVRKLVDSSGWASWKPGRFLLRDCLPSAQAVLSVQDSRLERCGAHRYKERVLYRIQRMAMRPTRCFYVSLLAGYMLAGTTAAQPVDGPLLLPPPMFAAPAPQAAVAPEPEASIAEESLPLPTTTDAAAIQLEGDETLDVAEQGAIVDETPWFDPFPWDTGIELGINGSSGTSESLSVRTGGYIKRESRFSKLDLRTNYNYTTNSGLATQNNAELDVRNDWLLDDRSPWTLFGTGNLFYDEFQAFDLQTSANTGVGYRFVHDPGLDLIARLGGGASREIGGPDDRWVPESLVGFEYSQQLSATQKFYGKLDYYPEWEEIGEYRLVADTGWEIVLVQPSNLSLKISATDRYDSTPNGAEPHLLNYSVLLLLKL
jgi:putative salt-induced outer membrane protein YdiY